MWCMCMVCIVWYLSQSCFCVSPQKICHAAYIKDVGEKKDGGGVQVGGATQKNVIFLNGPKIISECSILQSLV